MYKRHLIGPISDALADTPVIVLTGARQTGKSTLCRELIDTGVFAGQMITLDDTTVLNAAKLNPVAFLENLSPHLVIDEVQRAPELLLAIKSLVDKNRKGRRLVLTGSTDIMTLPKVADSLAGRIEIFNLWPLSQSEIHGTTPAFLAKLLSNQTDFTIPKSAWPQIIQAICTGGYPEPLSRDSESRRAKWFESYLTAILQKDIRDLSNIEGLMQIPNILHLIATRISSTINMSDISRLSGVKNTTLQRYISLLEHIFLLVKVPAWTPNAEGHFVKSPRYYLNDTGLLCHLRGDSAKSLQAFRTDVGPLLENFVVMDIIKQASWSDEPLHAFHFSMHKGQEVDLVLMHQKSRIYGIEIKASGSLKADDFKGLQKLAEVSGKKFQKGIVLYSGHQVVPFGENLFAVPVSALWGQ